MTVLVRIALLLLLALPAQAVRPLGWNLESVTHYNTSHYFCDLMKESSRNWTAGGGASNLVQDANLWPESMSGGANAYYSVVARLDQLHNDVVLPGEIAHYPTGEYTIQCDGTFKVGVFRNGPDQTYQCSGTNTHTFTVDATTGEGLEFRIYGDTITNSGDPQLMQVYPSGSNPAACDPANEIFSPKFRKALRGVYGVRFMDWAGPVYRFDTIAFFSERTWANRVPLSIRTYADSDTVHNGVPPELPILLANEMLEFESQTFRPWIVLPVTVTDDYIAGYVAYIVANLHPLVPFIFAEFGNETWNQGGAYIDQFNSLLLQAAIAGITGDNATKVKRFTGQRSAQIFEVFKAEFGGLDRIRRVIGMQNKDCCAPSDASIYLDFDPDGDTLDAVHNYVDFAAFAPYGQLGDPENGEHARHSLNALTLTYDGVSNSQCGTSAGNCTTGGGDCPGPGTPFTCCATASCVGIRNWTPEQYCASLRANIASQAAQLATNVAAVESYTNAEANTLKAILYEGGINHDDRLGGSQANGTGEWDETLVFSRWNTLRAPCMAEVQEEYLNAMYSALHQQPIFLFQLIAKASKFRQFGHAQFLMDHNGELGFCYDTPYIGSFLWSQR